jgi:hypothetical protein
LWFSNSIRISSTSAEDWILELIIFCRLGCDDEESCKSRAALDINDALDRVALGGAVYTGTVDCGSMECGSDTGAVYAVAVDAVTVDAVAVDAGSVNAVDNGVVVAVDTGAVGNSAVYIGAFDCAALGRAIYTDAVDNGVVGTRAFDCAALGRAIDTAAVDNGVVVAVGASDSLTITFLLYQSFFVWIK